MKRVIYFRVAAASYAAASRWQGQCDAERGRDELVPLHKKALAFGVPSMGGKDAVTRFEEHNSMGIPLCRVGRGMGPTLYCV